MKADAQGRFGQTPLHYAAMRGELHTVGFLVETLEADFKALDEINKCSVTWRSRSTFEMLPGVYQRT